MTWLILLVASIATGQTGLANNLLNKEVDYRFEDDHGQMRYCVFCSTSDIEASYAESKCVDKHLDKEVHEVSGYNITYWPYCDSLETSSWHPRYIKNCSAAPQIPGASVDCKDEYGDEFYRVHDQCKVTCTEPRTVASESHTTCDPQTGTWTNITCKPNSCLPLQTKIEKDESSTCNITQELPLNTKCNVSCPLGYTPDTREVQCVSGDWELVIRCVEPTKVTVVESNLKIPLSIAGVALAVFVFVMVACVLYFRPRKKNPGSDSDSEANKSDFPLLTAQSVSSGSVSGDAERTEQNGEEETSLSETSLEGKSSPPLSLNERPPTYISAIGYSDDSKPLLTKNPNAGSPEERKSLLTEKTIEEECNSIDIYYVFNNISRGKRLPDSGNLNVAKGTRLTLYAVCAERHEIRQFDYGPSFCDDNLEKFGYGISMIIMRGDEGSYLLAARCDHQGEIITRLGIYVTDPDETKRKELAQSTDGLGSLNSTVTEESLTAGSEPSQKLEAEPLSLPSNPRLSLLMDSGDAGDVVEQAGAWGGKQLGRSNMSLASQTTLPEENDSEAEDCILPLTELKKQRKYKRAYDRLCELLEPLDKRQPDMTIYGATLHILGYSIDKVDHVVWAKRENLRDTPARTLLSMMIQAGKSSLHLVRYFAHRHHKHREVIHLLKDAHPDCRVCQQYN